MYDSRGACALLASPQTPHPPNGALCDPPLPPLRPNMHACLRAQHHKHATYTPSVYDRTETEPPWWRRPPTNTPNICPVPRAITTIVCV